MYINRSPYEPAPPNLKAQADQASAGTPGWGPIGILIHWLTAILVPGLFALGLWMTGLSYYDAWYRQGPYLHKGLGVVLFGLLLARLLWRPLVKRPAPLPSHSRWERQLSRLTHLLIYCLMIAVLSSGYLISTADGRTLEVFGWFEIPAMPVSIAGQADIAGAVHFYLACALIGTVALHIAGALKHHFIDRDATLLRMIPRRNKVRPDTTTERREVCSSDH